MGADFCTFRGVLDGFFCEQKALAGLASKPFVLVLDGLEGKEQHCIR